MTDRDLFKHSGTHTYTHTHTYIRHIQPDDTRAATAAVGKGTSTEPIFCFTFDQFSLPSTLLSGYFLPSVLHALFSLLALFFLPHPLILMILCLFPLNNLVCPLAAHNLSRWHKDRPHTYSFLYTNTDMSKVHVNEREYMNELKHFHPVITFRLAVGTPAGFK